MMKRRTWRTVAPYSHIVKETRLPEYLVSVDQLQFIAPGLIAQQRGTPTRPRYYVATIFVYHATDFTYVVLEKNTTSEETVRAKAEFESKAKKYGVPVKYFHSDNVIFGASVWVADAKRQDQTQNYCRLNEHH